MSESTSGVGIDPAVLAKAQAAAAAAKQAPKNQLKPEILAKLQELDKLVEEQSSFMKIKDKETVVWYFPGTYELVDSTFKRKDGTPIKQVQWDVMVGLDTNEVKQKHWSTSVTTSKVIKDLLAEGYTVLKITRKGTGTDTEYSIIPAN